MTLHAKSLEEAEAMVADLQRKYPDGVIQPLHVKARIVEAGIEVVVQGAGVYNRTVIDPNTDPALSFHILEHMPDAVQSALMEMLDRIEGPDGSHT